MGLSRVIVEQVNYVSGDVRVGMDANHVIVTMGDVQVVQLEFRRILVLVLNL